MPKAPYVNVTHADRHCICCGKLFTPSRVDQVYCEGGKESKDSCYWKLRLVTDPLNSTKPYGEVLHAQDYHCWKCLSTKVRPMLTDPLESVSSGVPTGIVASCTPHRMAFYRELAERMERMVANDTD